MSNYLTREHAETRLNELITQAENKQSEVDDIIEEAKKHSDIYGLEFAFGPSAGGWYEGSISHAYALHLIESKEFETLGVYEQERVQQVLGSGEDEEVYNESWHTSFC